MFLFQWLWASIQMEARADELMYLFEEEMENSQPNSRTGSCRKTPSSVTSSGKSRSHRRKRLRENLAKLAHEGLGDTPLVKARRSSYSIACQPLSSSQLDNTATELSSTVVVGNVTDWLCEFTLLCCTFTVAMVSYWSRDSIPDSGNSVSLEIACLTVATVS